MRGTRAMVCAALLCGAAPKQFWQTGRTEAGVPFALADEGDEKTPMLRFECAPNALVATVYNVPYLEDPESGKKLDATSPVETIARASRVSLMTDGVDTNWVWTEARRNPTARWDLTAKLPLDDPNLRAFAKTSVIGIITHAGGTAAVVEKGDRARLADFVWQCGGGEQPSVPPVQ